MAGAPIVTTTTLSGVKPAPSANPLVRTILIVLAVGFLTVFILIPLVNVFVQAFA